GPPLLQSGNRGLTVHGSALQPQLQHLLVGLADLRPRSDPQDLHDLVAVQVRTDRIQLFLLLEPRDALLQSVVRPRKGVGLALVTSGAVRPRQLVQPLQLRTGVPYVAAHSRVRPLARPVSVEAQM